MYWLGDSRWPMVRWLWRIPGEIIQGTYHDNIPLCCSLWYTLVKLLCMFLSAPFRTILREDIGYGWAADLIIFSCLFKGDLDKKTRVFHSEDFRELQYWRCPICRAINRKRKLNWTTGIWWEWYRRGDDKRLLETNKNL